MGKRSDFKRLDKDSYNTFDPRAYVPIKKHFDPHNFYEPCCGEGEMTSHLVKLGWSCVGMSDIRPGMGRATRDAFSLNKNDINGAQWIVTNPPWSRNIMHPMIRHFVSICENVLLLMDADWAYTNQAKEYMTPYLTDIYPIGRLQWIPGTGMTGKDNCAWYKFSKSKNDDVRFHI